MTGLAVRRIDTSLPGVVILEPRVHEDRRGFFMESYNERSFAKLGISHRFVQDNHSRSVRGVLRGLHYQLRQPQAKLVRVTRGRVFDVAVDIRRGNPHFGAWTAAELTEDNRRMMFAPEGFAHGFLVLSEVAEFQYKCSDFYDPSDERGIAWNDPRIAIDWPLGELEPILSGRDLAWSTLDRMSEAELPRFEP
jgi:dTDP-4-dehydrorhamnose 3,5-epimerase